VRGIAISMDSLVAISFFMFVMVLIAGQAYQPRSPGSMYLKMLTLDLMSVAEKSGRMDTALAGNGSAMDELVASTPTLACISIRVLDNTEEEVAAFLRSDCNESEGLDIQVATRPYLYHGSGYLIRAESWFRKEGG